MNTGIYIEFTGGSLWKGCIFRVPSLMFTWRPLYKSYAYIANKASAWIATEHAHCHSFWLDAYDLGQ